MEQKAQCLESHMGGKAGKKKDLEDILRNKNINGCRIKERIKKTYKIRMIQEMYVL